MKIVGTIVEAPEIKEEGSLLEAKYSPLTKPVLTGTINSSGWSGTAAPYTNTLTVTGILADPVVYILDTTAGATDAQVNAFDYGRIRVSAQATGSMSLKAYGVKPTINIPVRIIKI